MVLSAISSVSQSLLWNALPIHRVPSAVRSNHREGGTLNNHITSNLPNIEGFLVPIKQPAEYSAHQKEMMDLGLISEMPFQNLVSAVSVGIVDGGLLLDLDYQEDSSAEVDMNVTKTDTGKIVEIQATAEKSPFTKKDFNALLSLADKGIKELFHVQKEILKQRSLLFMAYG